MPSLNLKPQSPMKVPFEPPGLKERIMTRWGWSAHLMRALERFSKQHANYYASAVTFSAVLALFPMVMVTFWITAQILVNHPAVVTSLKNQISNWIAHATRTTQINDLIDEAINAKSTVGFIGVLGMFWTGLNFMGGLREALTLQWAVESPPRNFFKGKLQDLIVTSVLFVFGFIVAAMSIIFSSGKWNYLAHKAHMDEIPGYFIFIHYFSLVSTFLLGWLLWTYIIAKLPRVQLPLRRAAHAGFLNEVLFLVLLSLIGIIIRSIERNPILRIFIAIISIMLFFYWCLRILLFCTCWAATDLKNQRYNTIKPPPSGVVIIPRMGTVELESTPDDRETLFDRIKSRFKR